MLDASLLPGRPDVVLLLCVLGGVCIGSVVGLCPAVHVYAIAAGLFALRERLPAALDTLQLTFLCLGLLIGWTLSSIIPSVLLYAPDDAGALTVLPATKLLLLGRGREAIRLIGAGALAGTVGLLALAPLFEVTMRPLRQITQGHTTWMVAAITAFLVLGEWPRANELNPSPLKRLLAAWSYLGAGLLTFLLSGALGLILKYHSPLPAESSYQSLLPAFSGLFAVPGLLQIALLGAQPPHQSRTPVTDPEAGCVLRGALVGLAGGLFAGFIPVVSGGIGALLAGHAAAQRDDRQFLISQGASRMVYTVGGMLLLFVPGLALSRGGMSALITLHGAPSGPRIFWLALAGIALGTLLAYGLLETLAPLCVRIIHRAPLRVLALAMIAISCGVTWLATGVFGLLVQGVASAIGLIPVLFGGRRMNCLGVLLLPMFG